MQVCVEAMNFFGPGPSRVPGPAGPSQLPEKGEEPGILGYLIIYSPGTRKFDSGEPE